LNFLLACGIVILNVRASIARPKKKMEGTKDEEHCKP